MRLSKNFTRYEFERSQAAVRHGIRNEMGPEEIINAQNLAQNVLQPVRDRFGPTVINSGFRSKKLNGKIGGSKKSQHIKGQAADIEVPGISNYEVAKWMVENLSFDQLILEGYVPEVPNSGWIHVSYVDHNVNRNEVLSASFRNGKVTYTYGFETGISENEQ